MFKFTFILSAFALFGLGANAQTQRIAHRSHSGSNKAFAVSKNENWGLGPEQIKKMQVERLNRDSLAIKSHQADSARIAALKQLNKKPAKKKKVKKG